MCGINGILSFDPQRWPVDPAELTATRDAMAARGPDAAGTWLAPDRGIGLGHRRLAIIDLSDGAVQPMADSDQHLHIVFNGEIYNYRHLRRDLIRRGRRFRTHSDTEVLLHLYDLHGESMVHQLRGMFAFAIWDSRQRKLFLARDRYGIKPLYYSNDGRRFRFASQIKALQAGHAGRFRPDPAGVVGYLLWGSVPEPLTVLEDVNPLPAGHTLTVTESGPDTPKRYWNLADAIAASRARLDGTALTFEQAVKELRDSLLDSVTHHLVADVPVGAFLSAGLDSATLVGLARESGLKDMQAITLAFEEFKHLELDELPHAIEIARHFGVSHHYRHLRPGQIETELTAFCAAMDQPTVDGLNTWLVSKIARETGLKVALSGLGGDELLGGYATFRTVPALVDRWLQSGWKHRLAGGFAPMLSWLARHSLIGPTIPAMATAKPSFTAGYRLARGIFMPWELPHLLRKDFLHHGLERYQAVGLEDRLERDMHALDPFAKVMVLEASCYMRNQLLRDTDWTGMAHSLEIRVPLVDHVLADRIAGMVTLGCLGKDKSGLPLTLTRQLPEEITRRKKTGFTLPTWRWLSQCPFLSGWKGNPYLHSRHVRAYQKWAYCMLDKYLPESWKSDILLI